MPRVLLPLATVGFLLSACAAVPKLDASAQIRSANSYATTHSLAAPVADWPVDRWWSVYGDVQLDALMDEALAGSPTLAQAAARVRRAQAQAEQARSSGRPQLSARGQAAEEKQSYNSGIPADFVPQGYNDVGRASLDLSWDLDLWGRNRAAVAAAVSEAEATRLDGVQSRLMLTTSVAAAYADLARLFGQRDAAARGLENRRSSANLVSLRVTEGAANRGEAQLAASAAAAAAQDLAAVDEQIGLTRHRLAALLGAGPDRGLSIQRPAGARERAMGLPANLAADLIGRRPDIQAARLRAEAARQRVKVAKAGFYPNLNLAAFIGVQSLGLNMLTKDGSDIGQIGLAPSLPIFSAGRLEGAYRGARADYDAAVASYDQTLTDALRDVADTALSVRFLQGRLTSARQALVAAEDSYRIARLRYEGGLSTYLTVLTAEDAAIAQRRSVADLEARARLLDAQLARALGGGFNAAA